MGVGSRHEDESRSGITHFIEHLLFKGTETRSARDIAESMDAVGGHLNAFTSKECTSFYAKVLDEHLGVALDVLSDMLLHPRFDSGDVDRERGVVLEEIMMYEDTPDELVHDLFAQSLWAGHPLGRAVQGTAASVKNLQRPEIAGYFRERFVPANIVVAAAGNVGHARFVEEVAARMGMRSSPGLGPVGEEPLAAPRTVFREKDIEQVHVCLGAQGLAIDDGRIYDLQVMDNILGGGTSSRLFQRIREEQGLAYSVYAYHGTFRDGGLVGIYLAASPGAVNQALELAHDEVRRLIGEGISPQELARCKEQLKAGLLLSLESTSSRMHHLGKSELFLGRVETPEDIIRRVEAVSAGDVQSLAAHLWESGRLAVAVVGPVSPLAGVPAAGVTSGG